MVIDTKDNGIGLVAVMPIGITEVSSISNKVAAGDQVEKGDEIGCFSLGGSTLCLVFQPGAIKEWRFTWPPQYPACPPTVNARDWIAIAN